MDTKTCPVSGTVVSDKDVFCPKCNANIKVRELPDFEDLEHLFSDNAIRDMRVINKEIQQMVYLDTLLEEQQEHLSALNIILGEIQEDVEGTFERVDHYTSKLRALNSISLLALRTKIRGNRAERLDEYVTHLDKFNAEHEIFLFHERLVINQIQVVTEDLETIQQLMSRKHEIRTKRVEILEEIAPEEQLQRSEELADQIDIMNEDLGKTGRTLRRLRIVVYMLRSALENLDKIRQIEEEDVDESSIEYLDSYLGPMDYNPYRLPGSKFLAANARRHILGVVAYGKTLGHLNVEIPSAGEITLETYFDDIIELISDEDKLISVINQRGALSKILNYKISYLSSILDLLEDRFQEKKARMERTLEKRLEFDLYLVESYLSRN